MVARDLRDRRRYFFGQDRLRQPIQGWMGHAEPFVMGPGYRPGAGMRRFISGTPPVLGMVGIADTVDLVGADADATA